MRVVVVGGVAAGLSAASRARRLDASLEITVLEKGRRISYAACGLPYLIEGQVASVDALTVYKPEKFERERNIRIRTGAEVVSLQHPRRELVLANGERVKYDRLVWTSGAREVKPSEYADDPRAFVLHTDADAEKLQGYLRDRNPKTAAVLGGGYIGLEMATALRARGLKVSLYQETTDLLGREDAFLTGALLSHLERCRIETHLNTRAPARLDADLILTATGLKPNVTLAAEAGIELGRTGAIRTTETLETNLHGVYAAGDCAETTHVVSGRPIWLPLGTTANKMGRIAGANVTGRRERFPGIAGTSLVRVGGLAVGLTGFSELQARREGFSPVVARISAPGKARYFWGRQVQVELTADRSSRRLVGGSVLGDEGVAGRVNVIATALTMRMTVDDFAQLDLSYAPPYATAMDPLLIAAQQLLHLLD
jgi:NADPH-dependent 2,4-dienoyl-CoA reductase/sulfur reductase-like enzyme